MTTQLPLELVRRIFTAAVAVIGGLIYTRYLNPIRSVASASAGDVQRILAPALRAALQPRIPARARPMPVAAPL